MHGTFVDDLCRARSRLRGHAVREGRCRWRLGVCANRVERVIKYLYDEWRRLGRRPAQRSSSRLPLPARYRPQPATWKRLWFWALWTRSSTSQSPAHCLRRFCTHAPRSRSGTRAHPSRRSIWLGCTRCACFQSTRAACRSPLGSRSRWASRAGARSSAASRSAFSVPAWSGSRHRWPSDLAAPFSVAVRRLERTLWRDAWQACFSLAAATAVGQKSTTLAAAAESSRARCCRCATPKTRPIVWDRRCKVVRRVVEWFSGSMRAHTSLFPVLWFHEYVHSWRVLCDEESIICSFDGKEMYNNIHKKKKMKNLIGDKQRLLKKTFSSSFE